MPLDSIAIQIEVLEWIQVVGRQITVQEVVSEWIQVVGRQIMVQKVVRIRIQVVGGGGPQIIVQVVVRIIQVVGHQTIHLRII